jgi:GntR family transcriptional repressor for pyruvate dehydrogenase complex
MTAVAPNLFHPVQRVRAAQAVVEQIRDLLAQGRVKVGDRLPAERNLADLLGVGRSTIREGLRIMESLGMIAVRPGDGTYLTDPAVPQAVGLPGGGLLNAWRTRQDLFELRMVLEPGLAALAARRASPEDLIKMHAILAAQRGALERGESGMEEDVAFHCLIAEVTGNAPLIEIMRGLTHLLRETRNPALRENGRPHRSLQQNQAILAAIEGRNPDLAMRRMFAHIRSIERILFSADMRRLGNEAVSPRPGSTFPPERA